jgi:choline monooxygenase
LHQISVAEWGPFVFANLDPEATSLEEWLGEVPGRLAEHGVDVGRLSHYRHWELDEYAANWKVCAENFLECYHCAIAHPSLAKAIDVSKDAYALTTGRWHSLQVGPPKNGGGGVYDAVGEVERGIFVFLFPNTVLNAMPGKLNLSIGPILPRGAERTFRFFDYFIGPDTDAEWLADFVSLETQVGEEDRALVERVQRGLRNGVVGSGNLMPESERLIAHFQSLVAEELAAER